MKSTPVSTFIVGLTVGSVLGMLFAPEKGTKTRRKMKDTISDIAEEVSRRINKIEKAEHSLTKKGKSTIMHINKNIGVM